MPAYYIHYADPGFPDPPWPGERRLGPFPTLAEAQAQAVSNSASGYGDALGIWSDENSTALEQGETPAADIAAPVIAQAGAALAADLDEDRRLQFEADALARAGASIVEITAVQSELDQRIRDRDSAAAAAMVEAGAT